MTRVGLPNDLPKFQPTQPLARCLRVLHDAALVDGGGEADRDGVVLPAFRGLLDLARSIACGESLMPESNLRFSLPRNHQLHVRAADVDDEDFFLHEVSFRADGDGRELDRTGLLGFRQLAGLAARTFAEMELGLRDAARLPPASGECRMPSACSSRALMWSFRKRGSTSLMISSRRVGSSIGKAISTRRMKFRGIQSALAR